MLEQSIQDDDEDYFYDRLHFMKQNFDNDSDVYKSNKVEDKIEVTLPSGTSNFGTIQVLWTHKQWI